MAAAAAAAAERDTDGRRLVDVLTAHYYPQGGEFGERHVGGDAASRNSSTRSLWDPTYVDPSWIGDRCPLHPAAARLGERTTTLARQIGITEYNWGAESHINGATTQADMLGIFGREGLDMATRWTTPDTATPTYKAIKMFRNYDGQLLDFRRHQREDDLVAESGHVCPPSRASAGDGAMTVMVINKVAGSTPVTLSLANFTAGGAAQVWQLTSANAINRLADVAVTGSDLALTCRRRASPCW